MSDLWEEPEWKQYVDHFRRDTLKKITGSSSTISLVPSNGVGDVKFWTELGASIMLDKPILAIVMPGATIPSKLRAVADAVVEADIDTLEGRKKIADEIGRLMWDESRRQ